MFKDFDNSKSLFSGSEEYFMRDIDRYAKIVNISKDKIDVTIIKVVLTNFFIILSMPREKRNILKKMKKLLLDFKKFSIIEMYVIPYSYVWMPDECT